MLTGLEVCGVLFLVGVVGSLVVAACAFREALRDQRRARDRLRGERCAQPMVEDVLALCERRGLSPSEDQAMTALEVWKLDRVDALIDGESFDWDGVMLRRVEQVMLRDMVEERR